MTDKRLTEEELTRIEEECSLVRDVCLTDEQVQSMIDEIRAWRKQSAQHPKSESSGDYYRNPAHLLFGVSAVRVNGEIKCYALTDQFGRVWMNQEPIGAGIGIVMEQRYNLPLTEEDAWKQAPEGYMKG